MCGNSDISFGVASSPYEFVGYWGYEEQNNVLEKLAGKSSKISRDLAWDGTLASLSAGSFLLNPDAWVRVSDSTLILGREPFGRMPLYWLQIEEVVWFASRLQLLLPLIPTPEVSIPGLYGYSCFSYVPTPLTPVKEISAVVAGRESIWKVSKTGSLLEPEERVIWQWKQLKSQIQDEREAIARLQTLLVDAVERQMADLPDAPVGVCLSGGLDSSIIAALLVRSGIQVRAYTLDFGDSGVPEYPYAQQVADWLKIPLVKVDVTPQSIKKALPATVKALDLPFGDGVTAPLFLLNRVASQEVQVIFNGEGGDQLFAGWTNKPLIAANVYREVGFVEPYLDTFHRLWGYEDRVFQPQIYAEINQIEPHKWIESTLEMSCDRFFLHRLRRAGLMLKGAQNIQPRATNLALSHKLHVRSPFCDLPLASFTFELAGELCLQGACEKYILKKAVESWLPSEIVWRQKRGMGVPLTSWCLNQWWRSLGTWLNPAMLEAEGRWQSDLASRIAFGRLGGQIQGRRIGEILWLLIIWQCWRVEVLKEPIGKLTGNHPFWLPHQFWKYWKNEIGWGRRSY
jgi:asparagine synthase (glutamine-hydrolysing)